MAKIIRFPGSEDPESRSRSGAERQKQELGLKVNSDKMVSLLNALTGMVEQIPAARRSSLLKSYLEVVRNYTDPELIHWVEKSTPSQWQTKAMFFTAIYKEIERRNLF